MAIPPAILTLPPRLIPPADVIDRLAIGLPPVPMLAPNVAAPIPVVMMYGLSPDMLPVKSRLAPLPAPPLVVSRVMGFVEEPFEVTVVPLTAPLLVMSSEEPAAKAIA